jgi:hypothetical protein|tara:strand:+ start:930 stop:1127 length:198 start_codon:yes stop_codon:yes gene_type:complete
MGAPSPHSVGPDTIRMTIQVEVPYENDIMNYGEKSKQLIRDYINSDKFGGYKIEAGAREWQKENQ